MRLPISRYDAMDIRLNMLRAISIKMDHGTDDTLIRKLYTELKRRV